MTSVANTTLNWILRLTSLMFVVSGLSFGGEITDEEISKLVTDRFGPILSKDHAPILYGELDRAFSRLSEAQQELTGSQYLSISELKLIDSPVQNAFVITQKADGIHRLHNHVFITTALLKKMFGSEGPGSVPSSELKKGMVRIVGVLSHELAHPVEETDSEALKKTLGTHGASQAREIRADAEGSMIARKAGYPEDSVYQGLSQLFSEEKGAQSALNAMTSSHPENNLRLSSQRMMLTLGRYQQGASEPSFPEPAKPAIAKELGAIFENQKESQKTWQFVRPKSVSETVERVLAVPRIAKSELYKTVEFNRLILTLDQMLRESGDALSEVDRGAVAKLVKAMGGGSSTGTTIEDFPRILSRSEFRSFFSKDTWSEEFRSLPDHFEALKSAPFYQDPRYVNAVKESLKIRQERLRYPPSSNRALPNWLSMDRIFTEYHEDLKEVLSHLGSEDGYKYIDYVEKHLPLEYRLRMAKLFYDEVLPAFDEKQRIVFAMTHTPRAYASAILPLVKTQETKFPGILVERTRLLGDSRKSELQGINRAIMRKIWNNRGYWATLETIIDLRSFDWPRVWESLGIEESSAKAQLRAAVKKFTSGSEYVELLKIIEDQLATSHDAIIMRKAGFVAGKFQSMTWLDSTMWPYLSGEKNPLLETNETLKTLARQVFGAAVFSDEQVGRESFRKAYGFKMREQLERDASGRRLKPSDIISAHERTLERTGNEGIGLTELVDFLEHANLPVEEKAEVLKTVVLKDMRWMHVSGDVDKRKVALALKRYGVASITELFEKLLAQRDPSKSYASSETIGLFRNELITELQDRMKKLGSEKGRTKEILSFTERFLNPRVLIENVGNNSTEMRALKRDIVALSKTTALGPDESKRLFKALTGTGASRATDGFFHEKLAFLVESALSSESHAYLREVAENKSLLGTSAQVQVAKKLLDGEVQSLEKRGAATQDIESIVKRINKYIPEGSLKKDDYLEELSWKLNVKGGALRGLIEDEKSYNWKKANPLLVNMGSGVSGVLSQMDEKNRFHFIEYLLSPEGRELPAPFTNELESKLFKEMIAAGGITTSEAREKAKFAADKIKYKLEAALMDATPVERIPIYEMLLSSGERGLAASPDFPYNITRNYLGYKPGSTEEKMLTAFLKVVPPHEKTVTLAYLLSQVGQDKSSVKSLFEVFQTVGIKFGQMSSVWKIFGEKVAKETEELMDNAKPMTKAEIEAILERDLSPDELTKIKSLKKVLGSASLKTVALVELKDGREVAVLVQRPHAEQQIKSNLDLSLKFVQQLKRDHVDVPSGLFDVIVEDLRSQLLDETKMSEEVKKIKQASAHFEKLNLEMKNSLNGYRFEVPDVIDDFKVRDNILFLERANGITWKVLKKVDPATAKVVGDPIAESFLRTLFRAGWFDPDRHGGNFMVDVVKKVIYLIDFGQAEKYSSKLAPWKEDERQVLARFLNAISSQDADNIAKYGQKMSTQKLDSSKARLLVAEVRQVLHDTRGKPESDRIIGVVSAFADSGLKLERKFSFGALKGLMMLQGGGYVPPERFRDLVKQEAGRLMVKKAPLNVPVLIDQSAECVLKALKLNLGH